MADLSPEVGKNAGDESSDPQVYRGRKRKQSFGPQDFC